MSKGILNNRDKMIWDNTHKPDISDVVGEIDDEMDDLLDDHDDKIVDIVGDNMNDLLDAHDNKVVSIVGDNMSTLLSSNAAAIRLIAGDKSGIGTTEAVKVGTWDATNDIYAKRYTGTLPTATDLSTITLDSTVAAPVVFCSGYASRTGSYSGSIIVNTMLGAASTSVTIFYSPGTGARLQYGATLSEATYDIIVYYLVSTATT